MGAIVRLSTGEIARVTAVPGNFPLRPTVEVINSPKPKSKVIELIKFPSIVIAKVLESTA